MKTFDIHTHGIAGFDTRTSNPKDILRMAEIQASLSVSEIIPTIYPDSIQVMRENMTAVKMAMEMHKPDDDRCAIIPGVHLEGPFLNPGRCGALNSSSFVEPTEYHLKELLEGFEDMVKIITIAPELNGVAKLIRKISDMGIAASMGHSDATYSEAEAGFNAGAKGITHLFNAMRSFHHREPGIVGFGLLNKEVYIEVIADPYHLNIKTLDLIFKTKNPAKIILISDSVKGTKISKTEKEHGVVDATGRLQGGSMSIMESSHRLTELGFNEVIIKNCITKNPETYLFELT